jgi:hypothetical protein
MCSFPETSLLVIVVDRYFYEFSSGSINIAPMQVVNLVWPTDTGNWQQAGTNDLSYVEVHADQLPSP